MKTSTMLELQSYLQPILNQSNTQLSHHTYKVYAHRQGLVLGTHPICTKERSHISTKSWYQERTRTRTPSQGTCHACKTSNSIQATQHSYCTLIKDYRQFVRKSLHAFHPKSFNKKRGYETHLKTFE
jgi:hypothetical protein